MTPSKVSIPPTPILIGPASRSVRGRVRGLYRCHCGTEFVADCCNVAYGNTRSCGCYKKLRAAEANTTHGYGRATKETGRVTEYAIWCQMKQRCYYPKANSFHLYGARGITVCRAWRNSFAQFLADMGPRPSRKHTLERRNNNKSYSLKNCSWATYSQQARNRRNSVFVTVEGIKMVLIEACEKYGVPYKKAYQRINTYKWSVERTFGVGK